LFKNFSDWEVVLFVLVRQQPFVEVLLPVKELAEYVGVVAHILVSYVFVQVELHPLPLNHLRVVLASNQAQQLLPELRNTEVAIGTKNLSKTLLVVWTLVLERSKTQQQHFI